MRTSRNAGWMTAGVLVTGMTWTVLHAAPPGPGPQGRMAGGDAADARTPVPMPAMMAQHQKANMRDHLLVVQEVLMALHAGDLAAAEKSALRMGTSEEMKGMCQHMGAAAPGFPERALAFHAAADGIVEAARKKDAAATQKALADTLVHCTSCHATYRQEVVSMEEYRRLAGDNVPPMMKQQRAR